MNHSHSFFFFTTTLNKSITMARDNRHEYITLEHILFALLNEPTASRLIREVGVNVKKLEDNLQKPLTLVPDPFEKYDSFGEHNNEMLKKFLDEFKFKYIFKSSTSLYKSGFFNETLKLILKNYNGIMDIIIPTLGKERQKTYSPFLPICPNSKKVLEIPVIEIDEKNSKIVFDNCLVIDNLCKLPEPVPVNVTEIPASASG